MLKQVPKFCLVVLWLVVNINPAFAQEQTLRDMLSGTHCPASCYMGIVPGVTTQAEFEQLLIEHHIQAEPSPIGPNPHLFIYSFPVNDPNGYIIGSGDGVYVDVSAKRVDQITILLTHVSLQDVLTLYGAPDVVTGKTGNLIIYKSWGLVFSTALDDPNQIATAFLQAAVEGRSRLSGFLDTERCADSPNCSIPTATLSPVFSPTPLAPASKSPGVSMTLTPTPTATVVRPQVVTPSHT